MGETLSTFSAARALGAMVAPVVHGGLYQQVGHTMPFCAGAVSVALALVLSLRLQLPAAVAPVPSEEAPANGKSASRVAE